MRKEVLIVAKCIVNKFNEDILIRKAYVLIVAKCIVNAGQKRENSVSFTY